MSSPSPVALTDPPRPGRPPGRRLSGTALTVTAVTLVLAATGCAGTGSPASGTSSVATTASLPGSVPSPSSATATTSGTSTPRSSSSAPTITDIHGVDFTNFTYQPDSCPNGGLGDPPAAGIPVRDGIFRREPFDSVSVDRATIVYGELTNDGRDEAAVTLECSTGVGSGTATSTWVFTPDPSAADGVRRLAFPALTPAQLDQVGVPGGYPKGAAPRITGGVLTLSWTVFTADDVPMFASKEVTTHLAWTGSAWRDAAPPTVADRPRGQ